MYILCRRSEISGWLQLAPSFPFLVHEITLLERRHKPLCITDENLTDDDVTLLPPVLRPRPKYALIPGHVKSRLKSTKKIS